MKLLRRATDFHAQQRLPSRRCRCSAPAALTALAFALAAPAWAANGPKPAEASTKEANAALLKELPFSDKTAFELAHKGFIAPLPAGMIKGAEGNLVWDSDKYGFIKEGSDAPDTVNPSLWRQAQLINISGLFQVMDGIYQVRNQDLSNMTIVEGKEGLTIMDPLISTETANAALDLYYQHRPKKPVVAVIYTHSHVDHYGGVRGVVDEADVKAGKAGPVPAHLRDGHYQGAQKLGNAIGYKFPHAHPDGVLAQQYAPDELVGVDYYEPTGRGVERELSARLPKLRRIVRGER